ncbi:hypothetical protein WG68_15470 [Arsukibacterium ikkense]|uniref:Uncharacterized protein n=1 Tax=Arsukibacterium ikkense TaxID=336831 RepID=A0A0M2V0R3_9GAMM|nr:hypothetical protein [Arsukibacterium ikkense]KKO44452.1 hypothetical protein WG68_15470 [Arsukibacterium ikkense]
MIKVFKALVITSGLTLALAASNVNNHTFGSEQLILDDLYACQWWPTCRDPDQQKPVPSDSSAPKPTGDTDTTKDKKDETQLA